MRLLMYYFFILSCLLISSLAFAKDEVKAEHAMVLFNQGSSVFVANLPTHTLPHNVQIVYKVDVADLPFLELVRDAELVTIKSKPFNIQRLIRGEEIKITADIYLGHYAHGGELVYADRVIELSKQLYGRELNDLSAASDWQEYDMITLQNNERIYIHKIQQAPSYNHLIFVDLHGACLQKFRTSSLVPELSELNRKFINCGTFKPLYYDTENLE